MCERIVLVFQFPVYINTIWEQAHEDAGLGALSMERSLRARGGSGSVWRWLIDQVIIMIMIWKHDHESASGAGMNSATLDKTEIKKRLKKRHHADSRVRFYFSDQYVLKSKIHILYIKSVFWRMGQRGWFGTLYGWEYDGNLRSRRPRRRRADEDIDEAQPSGQVPSE